MNLKTLNLSILLNTLFSLIIFSSIAQNPDSLDQIENPYYYKGYDTLSVQNIISGKSDSNIIVRDTLFGEYPYTNHIEYLGSFTTLNGARYKLVRFITCQAGEALSLSCSPIFHKILVFDNGNDLIGFYEIIQGTGLSMKLENGRLIISPHPRDYDCNIPFKGITNLIERFPINLNSCACVHRDNEGQPFQFHQIYFVPN